MRDAAEEDAVIPPPAVDSAKILAHCVAMNDGTAADIVRAAAKGKCSKVMAAKAGAPASASYLPPQPPQSLLRSVLELLFEYDAISGKDMARIGTLVRAGDCGGLAALYGGTRVTATRLGPRLACAVPPLTAKALTRNTTVIGSTRPRRRSDKGMTLRVHYSGYYENGKAFDSSRDRGKPFQFVLGDGGVIKGWEIGMAGMCEGEKRLLRIPRFLAYGSDVMIFNVELVEVRTPEEVEALTDRE